MRNGLRYFSDGNMSTSYFKICLILLLQRLSEERSRADFAVNDLADANKKLSDLTRDLNEMRLRCESAENRAADSSSSVSDAMAREQVDAAIKEAEQKMSDAHENALKEAATASAREKEELEIKVCPIIPRYVLP